MTAIEDRALPLLECADSYPAALRLADRQALPPEAAEDAPENAAEPLPEAHGPRRLAALVSRLRAPDGDAVITWAMTAAAAAVILFAAIVSYSHIHGLATGHSEDSLQAHLLPLSIDGVIAEASLVLLFAARHKLDAPKLARVMLWTGIVATLAANAVVALPPAWVSPVANVVIGAVLSAWPAAAFIASVELIMLLVRDVRAVAAAAPEIAASAPEGGSASELPGAPEAALRAAPAASGLASAPENGPRSAPRNALRTTAAHTARRTRKTASGASPEKRYADAIKSGDLPSLRQIRADMRVGQDRAKEIRASLEAASAVSAQ